MGTTPPQTAPERRDGPPTSEPDHGGSTAWPYWIAALALAICGAHAGYAVSSTPERYVQFTVGGITFRNAIKHADYALLIGFVLAFSAGWIGFLLTERRARREGDAAVFGTRALVGYAALPLLVWAGGLLLSSSAALDLAFAAGVTVAIATLLLWGAMLRPLPATAAVPSHTVAGMALLAVVLGALSAMTIAFALNRVASVAGAGAVWRGQPPPMVVPLIGAATAAIAAVWAWGRADSFERRMSLVLFCAQLALPWAFLIVVPLPWSSAEGTIASLPSGRALAIVAILGVATYVDLARRLAARRAAARSPLAVVSPLALSAALLFLKQGSITVPFLNPDEYHFGEFLLPVWTLFDQGATPFWDYVPARGLMNYGRGLSALLLFGEWTAAAVEASVGFFSLVLCLTCLCSLAPLIGLLPAAFLLLLMPLANGLAEIDLVNTAALAVLVVAHRRLSACAWLVTWVSVGTFIFLWGPAQGLAVILGTTPLAVWQLARAFRNERRRLRNTSLAGAAVTLALVSLTPLGRMLVGAVRYGAEHAAVGGPAHGIDWAASTTNATLRNRWLFEAVRTSWLAVPLAGIALISSAYLWRRSRRNELIVIGLPIVIIGLVFIFRAAGRIDPGHVSRLGYASMWMMALVMPLLLHAAWGASRWPLILALAAAGAGLMMPAFSPLDLRGAARRGLDGPSPAPAALVHGEEVGLPNIGTSLVKPSLLQDLRQIKRDLDILLDPGEPFLSLPSRNALYFYIGRPLPIESGAVYNLPNDKQQLRAIERLQSTAVPVVLAPRDMEFMHDGGLSSYRTHALYRYLVWRYRPIAIDGRVYLVRPDRLGRLESHPELRIDRDEQALLDKAFRMNDLEGLPAAWGAAWSTLSSAAFEVRSLGARSASTSPVIGWDDPSHPFPGRAGGLLVLELSCPGGDQTAELEVAWAAPGAPFDHAQSVRLAGASRVVIPLDASPRWLLAPAIGHLRVQPIDRARCPSIVISSASLWQRRVASHVDPG